MIDSPARFPFMVGILHDGTMMGNDRKIERNFPKNLLEEVRLFLLFAGCREIGMRRDVAAAVVGTDGGGGGPGGGNCIMLDAWGGAIGV